MRIAALALVVATHLVIAAASCVPVCVGRPQVVSACDTFSGTSNNFLETCVCDRVVTVNWQNCNPQADDQVGIYNCKGYDHTVYNYEPFAATDTGALDTMGTMSFPDAPDAYTCTCLVAIMNRNVSGNIPPYDIVIEGTEFIIPGSSCAPSAAPQTAVPTVIASGVAETPAPSGSYGKVTPSPSAVVSGAAVTPAPSGAYPAAIATPAPSGVGSGDVVTLAPSGAYPVAAVTLAPSGAYPVAVDTRTPSGATPVAMVTSAPSGVGSGPVVTSPPSGGYPASSVSPAPSGVGSDGAATPAPSESSLSPVSATPVTAPSGGSVAPVASLTPVPSGVNPGGVETSPPSGGYGMMTPAPSSVGSDGSLSSAPQRGPVPNCTGVAEDPYEYFGNGFFIPCCDIAEQCLKDWNNNSRVYYRCVEPGTCDSNLVDPGETPSVCTLVNNDPYQVYGNGSFIPCCNPSTQCLNTWDGDDRYYFRCVTDCYPAIIPSPVCTSRDQDPFQFFGNGTENVCCPGLVHCLDDWNNIDRFYYRCLECCANSCPADKNPSPTSSKPGVRSDQLANYVPKPGEVGVFVSKSTLASSGAIHMVVSITGILVGAFVCVFIS